MKKNHKKRLKQEKKLHREILKDLKILGGIPRKIKGDPFKLTKGLLNMSREEYEKLIVED